MKKYVGLSFAAMLVLAGCGSAEAETYYGESAADDEGVVTTVEYTKTGDDITDVTFDMNGGEYGDSKFEYSESGQYGMNGEAGEWHEQVTDLDTYVEENDAFPETESNGDAEHEKQVAVDGTTSATIGLDTFKEAFDAAEVK